MTTFLNKIKKWISINDIPQNLLLGFIIVSILITVFTTLHVVFGPPGVFLFLLFFVLLPIITVALYDFRKGNRK